MTMLVLTGAGCTVDASPDCGTADSSSPSRRPTSVHLSFEDPWSITNEVLIFHETPFAMREEDGRTFVDVTIEGVRNLPVPPHSEERARYLDRAEGIVLDDPRSKIDDHWRVDDTTVLAADVAYDVVDEIGPDVRSTGMIDGQLAKSSLPEYAVKTIWVDTYTGFAGVVFESLTVVPGQAHRIYALAGTHVFHRTDFRSWATGLTLSRARFVSGAALLMLKDAADYAQDLENGGEVFVTGQSQGALTAQGFGYLLQVLLNAEAVQHHLVHVVSWGGAGAQEAIKEMIEIYKRGNNRGYWPEIERHWLHMEPTYPGLMDVWNTITPVWDATQTGELDSHIRETSDKMRVVGYFFEIDLFARAGTFPGTTMVFPTVLLLPNECEPLLSERELGLTAGTFGIKLESHFLNAYQRAVSRGAIGLSRPADPMKWPWVLEALPLFDDIGSAWLTTLYLTAIGESEINWQRCFDADEWMTDRNRWCEEAYWPGCGKGARSPFATGGEDSGASWCLIARGDSVEPEEPFTDTPPPFPSRAVSEKLD